MVVMTASEMRESSSEAPWAQQQPNLMETPSIAPQRPMEMPNTVVQYVPANNELLKGIYAPAVTHGSQTMPAELSG